MAVGSWVHGGLCQLLVLVVLGVGVLREVLPVLALDDRVQIPEAVEARLRQELELLPPDDGDAHVLAGVGHDRAGQEVRVDGHEALLVEAEVREELGILLEVLGQLRSGLVDVAAALVNSKVLLAL